MNEEHIPTPTEDALAIPTGKAIRAGMTIGEEMFLAEVDRLRAALRPSASAISQLENMGVDTDNARINDLRAAYVRGFKRGFSSGVGSTTPHKVLHETKS